jgi:putative transposase
VRYQGVSPRERTSTALTHGVPLRVGVRSWRERALKEGYYPYLYLDATYLKVNWGGSVVGMVLLGCTGVDEEGLREVLAVAGGEKGAAYSSLLRCLLPPRPEGGWADRKRRPRGGKGGRFRRAARGGLATLCNALPKKSPLARAGERDGRGDGKPQAAFKVRREKRAKGLAAEFVEHYEKRYPKAGSVFEAGIGRALTYLRFLGSRHARIRTTNVLERLFQ